jgi:hypothetical protein
MIKKKIEIERKKWERVFEDDNSITIFKYDSKKSMVNPYEVDIKYKNEKKPPSFNKEVLNEKN